MSSRQTLVLSSRRSQPSNWHGVQGKVFCTSTTLPRCCIFAVAAQAESRPPEGNGPHSRGSVGPNNATVGTPVAAVLLAVEALGGNLDQAAADFARFTPPPGRGQRTLLPLPYGDFTLVDESYNANPASMRAALSLMRETQVGGKRIAVLGDMLELGLQSPDLHKDLAEAILAADVDLVFAAGPLMKNLFDILPSKMKGAWAETSIDIEKPLIAAIGPYDIVMVKGSNGSRMGPVVAKLKSVFARRDADQSAEG